MSVVKHEITLLLTSDQNNGAENVSADGSSFEVVLNEDLQLPIDALYANVKVDSATIWNVVPNILTGVNDKFYLDDNATPFVVTIDQGLYDLPSLAAEIDRQLVNLGADSGLLTFIGDNSTQRVTIQFNKIGLQIDFAQSDTMRAILGFDSRFSPVAASTIVGQTDDADSVAAFNNIEFFLIHSDLITRGFVLNNTSTDVVAQVHIDVSPGSQIIFSPFNPVIIQANELIQNPRRCINVRLTDHENQPVNTNGEFFSVKFIIEYFMLIN